MISSFLFDSMEQNQDSKRTDNQYKGQMEGNKEIKIPYRDLNYLII